MSVSNCPNDLTLARGRRGELNAAESRALAAHVASCPRCAAAVRQPDSPDTVPSTVSPPSAGDATPYWSPPAPAAAANAPPEIPGYQITGLLGKGGMGRVYRANDARLRRTVALKMILGAGAMDPDLRARFLSEARAVARLKHENIVQVFEVGEHRGLPYVALEYVDGGSLAARIRSQPLQPRDAAALVERLARAMAAAHDAAIIHRDLKPANVLLTKEGVPKVTDFGLAKQLDDDSGLTQTGAVLGTPSYMAPEQAGGDSSRVGPSADIYALGAVLYETLTGRPPFKGASSLETLELVRSSEPVAPRRLQPGVPADLETICLKSLRKDPARRYDSALELARDLARFLAGEPISARPVGTLERTIKWARRRPAVAGLLVAMVLVTIGGFGAVLHQLERTREARDLADDNAGKFKSASILAEQRAEDARLASQRALDEAGKARAAELKERAAAQLERAALAKAGDNLYTAHMNLVQQSYERAELDKVRELLLQHIPKQGEPDRRAFEWYYYWNELHSEYATLDGLPGPVRALSYSSDGRWLAIAVESLGGGEVPAGGAVYLWDTGAKDPPRLLDQSPQIAFALAFQPGGDWLAYTSGASRDAGAAGEVTLRNVVTGEARKLSGHTQPVLAIAFSPDGKRLATAGIDGRDFDSSGYPEQNRGLIGLGGDRFARPGEVIVWDAADGHRVPMEQPQSFENRGVTALTFTHDGSFLLGGQASGRLICWNAAGKTLWEHQGDGTASPIQSIAAGIAEQKLLVGTASTATGGRAYQYFVNADGVLISRAIATPVGGALKCLYSPGGEWMAVAGLDRTVRLWQYQNSQVHEYAVFRGHHRPVQAVAFSPDSRFLATGGWDHQVKLWALARPPGWTSFHGGEIPHSSIAVARELDEIYVSSWTSRSVEFHGSRLESLRQLPGKVFIGDDQRAYLASHDSTAGAIVIRALAGPEETPIASVRVEPEEIGHSFHVTPNRKWLVAGASTAERYQLRVRDVDTGELISQRDYVAHASWPMMAPRDSKVGPDSSRLVARDQQNRFGLWRLPDLGEIKCHILPDASITDFTFSPDSQTIATGNDEGVVRLWSARDLSPLHTFPVNSPISIYGICFSPDGRSLASGTTDGSIRLLDIVAREERMMLRVTPMHVFGLAFSSDGKTLFTNQGATCAMFGAEPRPEELERKNWDPLLPAATTPRYRAGRFEISPRRWRQWHRQRVASSAQANESAAVKLHAWGAALGGDEDELWNDADFQYGLGLAHRNGGEASLALKHLRRATELEYQPSHHALVHLAEIAATLGNVVELRKAWPTAAGLLNQDRLHPSWRYSLAVSLVTVPQAVDDWTPIVELMEQTLATHRDFESLRAVGLVQLRAGDYAQAGERLTESLQINPKSLSTQLALVQVRHRAGQPDAELYQRVAGELRELLESDLAGRPEWKQLSALNRRTIEVLAAEAKALYDPPADDGQLPPQKEPAKDNEE